MTDADGKGRAAGQAGFGAAVGVVPIFLLWGHFPSPLALAGVGVIPVLAVLAGALLRDGWSLGATSPPDRRSSLLPLLIGPAVALGLFLLGDGGRLLWTEAVLPWVALAAIGACASALLIAAIDRRQMGDTLMIVLSGLGAFVWLGALLAAADLYAPPTVRALTPATIVDKHKSCGKGGCDLELTLRTLDGAGQMTVPVPWAVYDQVTVGDSRCLVRARGVLGVWWKDSAECPPARPPP